MVEDNNTDDCLLSFILVKTHSYSKKIQNING